MAPVLILVGPPGSGTSTVGRRIAERLGVPFMDTDRQIEAATGLSVGEVILERGEAVFRNLERAAVSSALAGDEASVLVVGGGAIVDPQVRGELAGRPVVFLDVGLAECARRVGLNRDRPAALGNVRAQLRELLDGRRPLYSSVASLVIVTDGRSPEDIADEVVAADIVSGAAGRRPA